MLPATARLIHRDDFTAAVRRGRRVGRRLVVMHVLLADTAQGSTDIAAPDVPTAQAGARVGFIVSKAVGGSVVRHRVARRLRHLMRERIGLFPAGTRVVIRALPAAADADSTALGLDLDRALRTALSPRPATAASGASEPDSGSTVDQARPAVTSRS